MSEQPSSRRGAPGADLPALAQHQSLPVTSTRVIEVGMALWAVALVATLVVPGLHTGERSWWPWTCVVGLVLGGLGYAYVRRGRGNAADADG